MPLGLGSSLIKGGMPVASHVTSNLKMLHRYNAGSVVPVSDGAAYMATTEGISITEKTYSVHDTACSFAWWQYDTGGNTYGTPFAHTSTNQYQFIMLPNNTTPGMILIEGDEDNNHAKFDLNDDDLAKWHHFVLVSVGDTTIKVYQNGALLSMTSGQSNDVTVNLTVNQIGRRGAGAGSSFEGYMCNVATWEGTALTQAQVKSIMFKNYAGLTSTEKENMVSWWNLSENFNDSHGSNNGSAA